MPGGRNARPALVAYDLRELKVFLFFSNQLGCLGSLLVSLAVTVVLLLILGVIRIG
jgi:hypothetical protein